MIKIKKISFTKIAIILIALFSILGIISCSGDTITGGSGSVYSYTPSTPSDTTNTTQDITNSTNTGPTNIIDTIMTWEENTIIPTPTPEPEPEPTPTFPANTYRRLYVPFAGAGKSGDWNYTNVSYQDKETLTALWRAMIMRKGEKDGGENGKKFYLKTPEGDFFFDENLNIRWAKRPEQVLKRFFGGVMFKYQQIGTRVGELAIGGLYTYALHIKDLQRHGVNNDTTRIMFGVKVHRNWEHNAAGGRMEVLVLNGGIPINERGYHHWKAWGYGDWGAQSYFQDDNKGFQDGNYHLDNILGRDPNYYMPNMNSVNNLWYYQIRFSPKNYDMKAH